MTRQYKSPLKYAICVDSDDPDLLTPRMIYQVLPDESAARSGYIRVVDNEGEDYLYPVHYFVLIDFPQAVESVLQRILPAASYAAPAD